MKISVVIPKYSISGVPLAQLRFAKALVKRGHDVDLVVGGMSREYRVPSADGVNIIVLGTKTTKHMFVPIVSYLRQRKPDVVFSAEDHLNAIVLLASIVSGSKAKISASSRVTPYDTYSDVPFTKRWILKQLMRLVMWRADVLTCVSKDMVDQYRSIFRSSRHVCVYNIVDSDDTLTRAVEPVEDAWFSSKEMPVIVAAGRLAPWKGFGDLIKAIAHLPSTRKVRLIILGDGPQRAELQAQIEDLGLSESIRLLGYVDNPLKYFAKADVFVLSSLVEGMPNVLIEAMTCGCTPVATDCRTGPREILGGRQYGYLVPVRDPVAMAAGIASAVDRPIDKSLLAEAILPFQENAVIERHFKLLGLSVS